MPTKPELLIVAASASEPWLVGSLALAATLTKAKQASRYQTQSDRATPLARHREPCPSRAWRSTPPASVHQGRPYQLSRWASVSIPTPVADVEIGDHPFMPTKPERLIVAASASEPWLVGSLALAATLTKAKQASRYQTQSE